MQSDAMGTMGASRAAYPSYFPCLRLSNLPYDAGEENVAYWLVWHRFQPEASQKQGLPYVMKCPAAMDCCYTSGGAWWVPFLGWLGAGEANRHLGSPPPCTPLCSAPARPRPTSSHRVCVICSVCIWGFFSKTSPAAYPPDVLA